MLVSRLRRQRIRLKMWRRRNWRVAYWLIDGCIGKEDLKMNEAMAIEAVRASGGLQSQQLMTQMAPPTVDPAAASAFADAMGAPQAVSAPLPVPFADGLQRAWHASQVEQQVHKHRVSALLEMGAARGLSAAELSAMQYEFSTMGFELEVTTIIAKKASDAVSTLVKNG